MDEDEANEENSFDFNSMGGNFPGMSNMDFGGLGGDDDEADDSGSEDGDNADLPPLEEVEPRKPTNTATA